MKRRSVFRGGALAVLVTCVASAASAQQVGTAESGAATGDGAAPFYNPAAMALGDSLIELNLGGTFANLRFDPAGPIGATETTAVSPQITLGAYTDVLHETLRIGLTAGLPVISGGSWDDGDGGAGAITRYYLRDARLIHAGAALGLSWTPVPWLSFGASVLGVYGSTTSEFDKDFGAELNNMSGCSYERDDCLFPYADPLFAAPVDLRTSGFGVGGIFGVMVQPLPNLEIGFSFQTPVKINTPGTIEVEYPDSLIDAVNQLLPSAELPPLTADIEASMDLPMAINAGVVYRPIPPLELNFYYRWDQQSDAPFWRVRITQTSSPSIQDTGKAQGYENRHLARLRVGYAVIDALRVSLYGAYQTNTVPDLTTSPNNLDFARIELGLTARWRVSERIGLFLQYSHLILRTRNVTQSLLRPTVDIAFADFNRPSPVGEWSGSANGIRLGMSVHFDRPNAPGS
ncbi:MAG: outer membrane protein transport protein [Myxococcota bacterium]